VRVIQRIGRRGLSSAAIEGMCATAAPVVAVMDADHQHDPALLPDMLAAIEGGDYDLSYASRFAEGASTEAWGRPDRVKASNLANRIANKVTGVELSDPMSGYFMLRTEVLRADAHRLSGVGFKILLDILATVEAPLRIKEFPMHFAARADGESKLDRTVVFEFLVGLYDKWLGRIIPTRFALFGTIGGMGVVVHMAVLATVLNLFGAKFAISHYPKETAFIVGQTLAAVVAMSFNFVLNNELTYARVRAAAGWVGAVRADVFVRPAGQHRFGHCAGAGGLPRLPGGNRWHRAGFCVEFCAVEQVRLGQILGQLRLQAGAGAAGFRQPRNPWRYAVTNVPHVAM
jgi:dolichol-phosphate mannosyltransferase